MSAHWKSLLKIKVEKHRRTSTWDMVQWFLIVLKNQFTSINNVIVTT